MSTLEAASAGLGPRYAPDDPTLPNPWKGLIDGSTGVTYYWNPETNITQYEKPNDVPSSFVSGSSPAVNISQPAQMQSSQTGSLNGMPAQYGTATAEVNKLQPDEELKQLHHLNPFPQHSGLFRQQVLQTSQIPPVGQQGSQPVQDQHYPQYGQGSQIWSSSYRPTYSQQEPTIQNQFSQQMQQPVQQMQQQSIQQLGQPLPPNLGPQAHQYLGSAVGQHSAHQFMPQEIKSAPFKQPTQEQGNQSMQHQRHHLAQNLSLPYQQANRAGYPPQEDNDFLKRMQPMVSPSQSGQVGSATVQNLSHMNGSSQMVPQLGISGQGQGTGSGVLTRDANTAGQQYTSGPEAVHRQHGLPYQNQASPSMPQGQHFRQPPSGLNLSYGPRHHGIAGNDMYYNSSKDGLVMGSQHPKLAVVPGPTNQQSKYSGPIQTTPMIDASTSNNVPGYGWPDMKNRGSDSMIMPNQALGRAPPVHPGSSDFTSLTPDAYCQRHEVTTTGDNIPAPFMTFEATRFPQEILKEVRYLLRSRSICRTLRCVQNYLQQLFLWRLHNGLFGRLHPIFLPDMHSAGFLSPTPIQAQTWPIALQSRDIVAIAKTGSGKTLGYLVPAFILLMQCRNNSRHGPTVLVLAPTRELATQIQDEAVKFGQSSGLSCTCLYGGAPKGPQLRDLDRGADIVVATPGRLNDILEMKRINFRQVSLLVLDEADRMLDMGFEPQIRKIVNEIPPRRQTLMFTATWPKEVRKIAGDLLVNPVQVNIGNADELAANKAITQYVEVVPQIEKQRRLEQILASQERGSKIIVFCSTKKLCDELTRTIRRTFGAAAIHGDKSQGERDWVLNQFRSGKSPVLVATDVAARGLDIKDIRVVINYDFPTGVEDYVHRIGRTGRAGATGLAYTFLSEQDWKHVPELIKVLEGANQQVPPELREMAMRGGSIGRDRPAMHRFDSHVPGGRWDSGGGGRGSGFASRGGGFASGGGGGMRDRFVARGGGMRDGIGSGTRERFGGRGAGRGEFFSGRGRRGSRAFNGPGGYEGRGRDELVPNERFSSRDRYASGQGRFDHRDAPSRSSRGKSYSSSPERVRTWGYRESKSRNRSRSRSWSRSRSRSRSRSWSRDRSCSPSPRRSYGDGDQSWGRGRSSSKKRSRSPSYDNYRSPNDTVDKDRRRRPSLWDEPARDDVKPNAVDGGTMENLGSQTPAPSSIVHSDPLVGGSGQVMAKDMEQEGALVEQLDQSAA